MLSVTLDILHLLVSVIWLWLVAVYKAVMPISLQMKKDLRGQVALVTGAGNGIGRLLSLRLASSGCKMVLWDINEQGNLETARKVRALGSEVTAFTVDLSDRDAVHATADKVLAEFDQVDILVNNAGIVTGKSFLNAPDSLVTKTMDVNVNSHFWTVKNFLPGMLERNHGHIVTVASAAGLFGGPILVDYCASKFAAVGFTESLRSELSTSGKTGVRTTLVCPYVINTGMFQGAKTRFPKLLDLLEPENVAQKIFEAILTNQDLLLLPRALYLFYYLRGVLPVFVRSKIEVFMGVNQAMDDFTGRS